MSINNLVLNQIIYKLIASKNVGEKIFNVKTRVLYFFSIGCFHLSILFNIINQRFCNLMSRMLLFYALLCSLSSLFFVLYRFHQHPSLHFNLLHLRCFASHCHITPYNFIALLLISRTDVPVIQHYTLDDATMTYDTARQHCIDNEADLCLKSDICVNNEPILIGIQNGDRWTPVR